TNQRDDLRKRCEGENLTIGAVLRTPIVGHGEGYDVGTAGRIRVRRRGSNAFGSVAKIPFPGHDGAAGVRVCRTPAIEAGDEIRTDGGGHVGYRRQAGVDADGRRGEDQAVVQIEWGPGVVRSGGD